MRRLSPIAGLLSYFTRHRTAANLLLVILLALGIAAAPRMRAQFFPDIVVESIDVDVRWEGAGAEDVDNAIVGLMEPALLAVEGVESSESRSSEGRASIEVEFEPGWDMDRAYNDVQAAVDGISDLPEDAEEPRVSRDGWRDRVTDVVITGPVGVDQLARFSDEFNTRLFQQGVTRTSLRGLSAPNTIVEVPQIALMRHDLTLETIAGALAAAAEANPAGDVSGAARLRTGTARRTPEELSNVVLRSNPDGSTLRVGDVADIRIEGVDRDRAYFVGEDPAISLRVDRSATGDALSLQGTVESVAADMRAGLPQGVSIDLIRTRSEEISGRLNLLLDNGLMGLVLVVALLFLFLNARTALWVAAGIPVAMTAAIALMYVAGLTFNMISLFALILTLGIVVDDAIVVGEHADFRVRRLGETPTEAAETAAGRMFPPVFSATITTVIAFFGLVAVGGRFGGLIADIPFTVIVVLLASLIECFLILPNHMAHALASSAKQHWYDWPSRQVNRGFTFVRERAFRPLMRGVIRARYPVLAGAVALLAGQVALVLTGDVQWRFFNSPEQDSVSGNFAMLPEAERADTMEMMRNLQAAVRATSSDYADRYGSDPVAYAVAEIGGNAGRGLSGTESKESYQLGAISVELIGPDERPYPASQFTADLQDRIERHPLLETLSFRGGRWGPGGDSLDVQLFGAETPVLKAAAEDLKSTMEQYPEVSGLEDTLAYDKDEMVLTLTPQGEALGLSIDALGATLRNRLTGIEAATYPVGPRSAAIRVELPEDELTADFVDRTQVRTPDGVYVSLADVVSVETTSGFSTVRRENGIRLVSVLGDISEDDPARATEIQAELQDRILPQLEADFGVSTRMSGLAEQESEFLSDAATGFVLCLLGIYLTLAWIFASWTRPLVVMAIIPFGLVGTIWGHDLWGMPLSMFTVVGLIGMTGIIINDSIVLVTTADEYAEGRGLFPAIVDAACDRLRPVLLTTLTTVLGLAPLLYESSQQAEFLKPTVLTLVFGLSFGLVLVLLVVPALMAMQADLARQRASLRRALGRARGSVAGRAAMILSAGAAVLFALTIGATLWTGALPAMLGGGGPAAALAIFLAALAVLTLGVYAVAAALMSRTRRA